MNLFLKEKLTMFLREATELGVSEWPPHAQIPLSQLRWQTQCSPLSGVPWPVSIPRSSSWAATASAWSVVSPGSREAQAVTIALS